jgi:type I restriction enzyme M protein
MLARQNDGGLSLANERVTEDMVDAQLRRRGFYDEPEVVIVEKQQSAVTAIRSLLAKASKSGKGGAGYPEFVITAAEAPDMVVLIECKADVARHESIGRDRPKDFAVDGVLHYARFLSAKYNVIALAVSGEPKANRWSTFLVPKGQAQPRELQAPTGAPITGLVPMPDLIAAASFDPVVHAKRTADLIQFSQEMHEFMRDEAELEEKEKPLVVAGTLIALRNSIFATTYDAYPATELPGFWMKTIKDEITKASLPVAKVENMTQPFTAIEVHPELRKPTKAYPRGLLSEIVTRLAEQVLPFLTVYHDFDVVGQFYGEFLKYTGGDGKGLGIVLTPRHVTELFALIANVSNDDVVVDPCAGTGGFLISSMMKMIQTATTQAEVDSIKRDRLIGVEQQPTMYALAASNMILRGDGKANLYQGSCFDTGITATVKALKPTVGLVNPPYAKSKADLHELRFVEHMLDLLVRSGIGVAIVPVSCATAPSIHKTNLMRKNTLEAVMSMPPEIFHPVGVVTCVLVFTAGIPHAASKKKTWFGYWRDDGFVKIKNLGRVDRNHTWPGIRDRWIEAFRNREIHPGEAVAAIVGPNDEWLAEAYMETDYSTLTQADFEKVLLDYALFTLGQSTLDEDEE